MISATSKHTQRRFLIHRRLLFLITTCCSIMLTEGCNQSITLTASKTTCFLSGSFSLSGCAFDETIQLSLTPGAEACLKLQSYENITKGTIRLKLDSVRAICDKQIEFFTRDHKIVVDYEHVCYFVFTCEDHNCANVRPDDKLLWFSFEANELPGYTRCVESCENRRCGCYSSEPGCLFYRIYAIPTTSTIYEIFSCANWKMMAHMTASITTEREKQVFDFTLTPGEIESKENISLSLLADSLPPTKLFHGTYITDQNRTAMISSSARGQPIPGTIGQLQCDTYWSDFSSCTFPESACNCDPAEDRMVCNCATVDLQSVFQSSEKRLPLRWEGFLLQYSSSTLFADFQKTHAVKIQFVLRQFKLLTAAHENICRITNTSLSGCYSCTEGAELKYQCQTDIGKAMAHIVCGSSTATLPCEATARTYKVRITFSEPNISQDCTATCLGGITKFHVEGKLQFMEPENISYSEKQSRDSNSTGTGISEFFGRLLRKMKSAYSAVIGFISNHSVFCGCAVIAAIAALLLLLVCYFRGLLCEPKSSRTLLTKRSSIRRSHCQKRIENERMLTELSADIGLTKGYSR